METDLHLFISPHLDDVALSCGGYVRRISEAGKKVVVVTVMTADLPKGPVSWLARRNHLAWHLGDAPFALRRGEDEAAVRALGATHRHLGLLDAMYRRDDAAGQRVDEESGAARHGPELRRLSAAVGARRRP